MPAKWTHRFELKPGRWVFNPSPEARLEGAEIKALLGERWEPPSNYFHLLRGGHVRALQLHTPHSHFFKVDLADFFGSISRSRVSRVLKEHFGHSEALRIATASTVRHPDIPGKTILPYGFLQSPLVASMVLQSSGLGTFLDAVQRRKGVAVTVYVDDIIVSSDDPGGLISISEELVRRVIKSGFSLNPEKSQGPSTAITAFNIELSAGNALAVVEERLLEIKAVLEVSDNDFQRAGLLGYVRSVNADQADSLEPTPAE